jgi:hypothetical protein
MSSARAPADRLGTADGGFPVLSALAVGLTALFAIRRLGDPDVYWHLAAGRWIVEHGRVPRRDPLSFTAADHEWLNLQWLFDVFGYGLYQVGGASLLALVTATAYATTMAVLAATLRRAVGDRTVAVLIVAATLVMQERFTFRPEMLSALLLAVLLWLYASARGPSDRRLWWVVPIMGLWTNVHGLFVIGLFVVGCHGAAALGTAALRRPRTLPNLQPLALMAAAAAATLLNPYGWRALTLPAELFSRISGAHGVYQAIGEFRPPFSGYYTTIATATYQVAVVLSGLLVGAALARTGWRRLGGARRADRPALDVGSMLVWSGLLGVSLLARRNMGLFMLGGAPFLARCVRVLMPPLTPVASPARRRTATAATVTLAAGLLALAGSVITNAFYFYNDYQREFGLGVSPVDYPARAAAFLREIEAPPRLYNDMTTGGYLTWERPVPGGVFIDGRLEVYDELFPAYSAELADPRRWLQAADRWGINSALLSHRYSNRHGLIRTLAQSRDWALVYFDEVAVVYLRSAAAPALVAQARGRAPAWVKATAERLAAAPPRRRWPVHALNAALDYGALLATLGAADQTAPHYRRVLELGALPAMAVDLRVWLARYHAGRGEWAAARTELAAAAALAPRDERVTTLRAQIDERAR